MDDWDQRPDWIPPLYQRRLTSSSMTTSPRYAFLWLSCAPIATVAVAVLGVVLKDASMVGIGVITSVWNVYVAAVYAPRAYRAWQRLRQSGR